MLLFFSPVFCRISFLQQALQTTEPSSTSTLPHISSLESINSELSNLSSIPSALVSSLEPKVLIIAEGSSEILQTAELELLAEYTKSKELMESILAELTEALAKTQEEFERVSMALENKLLEEVSDAQGVVNAGVRLLDQEIFEIRSKTAQMMIDIDDSIDKTQDLEDVEAMILKKREEILVLADGILRYSEEELDEEIGKMQELKDGAKDLLVHEYKEIGEEDSEGIYVMIEEIYDNIDILENGMDVEADMALDAVGVNAVFSFEEGEIIIYV